MILGLGTDIIEIERMKESLTRGGAPLLHRLFSPSEIAYCEKHKDPYPHFAARFAAKEAAAKALGTGFGEKLSFLDLSVTHNARGAPFFLYSERLAQKLQDSHLLLSLSHSKLCAQAVVLHQLKKKVE